ncbi:unnamed protein product [Thelazia callipaeda]|uniref:STAS domain-containing protein n=1 Tax=Thelazia callipaeda TaxID=103827 RepID=A0A0N5D9U7_THECL|nr:unnamed protein product [Thelazia callipaeda]
MTEMKHASYETFELKYARRKPRDKKSYILEKVKLKLSPRAVLKTFSSFFPILHWLPTYDWTRDLHGDVIAGLTVGIIHVPQGMAYANLATLPPVYGMYTSFFTSTLYMIFGTSRHISIGVFAVASLMVGAVRLRILPDSDLILEAVNSSSVETVKSNTVNCGQGISPVELTSTLAMTVGLFQLAMAVLGLAFLTTYMSDALISGFTTGSAFHVFIAQLNKIIGVKLPRHSGFGMLFLIMRDLIWALPHKNNWALGISVLSIIFLLIGRDYINPWFKKRSNIPLPFELILVILVTIFSVQMDLKENYRISTVDYIPQGIPKPAIPKFDLMPYLLKDAFAIAIISYMFVISMAKLFAKKKRYKIDPTQELYAISIAHTLSSFFPIFPVGASLSRSAVCAQSGANTQLNILFSSGILLTVIVFFGPLLEPLPMCVLACIVLVSLKSLFLQFNELPKLWRISKPDFAVWLVSCIATVAFDVMTGLTISILFTFISVAFREQPKLFVIGRTSDNRIYKPLAYYEGLEPVNEKIKIVRFEAALSFINVSTFLDQISNELQTDISRNESTKDIKNKEMTVCETDVQANYEKLSQKDEITMESVKQQNWNDNACLSVIIDCGAISNIDAMGIEAIKEVFLEGLKVKKKVMFADVSEKILDIFERINIYSIIPRTSIYPSLKEALSAASNDNLTYV